MSQRFKIAKNINNSKNTRLPIMEDFLNYRFNRDELAHISRYLLVCELLISYSKKFNRPLKILDIGCGDIYIARTIQASFVVKKKDIISEYVGFDIDENILEIANNTKPKSFDIKLIQGDITNGGLIYFGNNSFDIVICLETIEHIKPEFVSVLLNEIKRIGIIKIISTPNFDGGTGKIPEDHIKEWEYDELKKEIIKSGMKIEKEIGIFSNINIVKKISKENKTIENIYNFLEDKMDSNFLSITMARFIGKNSQNILRICK